MIIVSGFSGSGKTTLCRSLMSLTGETPVRTSDFLIRLLGETRDKDGRLFAWGARTSELLTDEELRLGKEADQEHLQYVAAARSGIHESMTLPLLLDSSGDVCRVFLHAADSLRYQRVAGRHGISLEDALLLGGRKDAQTKLYLERAYGIITLTKEHFEHYDVVIRISEDKQTSWEKDDTSTVNHELIETALARKGRHHA